MKIHHELDDPEFVIKKHRCLLFRIAKGAVGNKEDAEDIVQQTICRAFIGWSKRNPASSAKAWLCRIESNVIADFYKKESKRATNDGVRDLINSAIHNNSELLEVEDRLEVNQMFARLTPEDAGILFLRDIEGFGWAEIAALLGRTVGQVRYRYDKARDAARKLLAG